MLSVLLERLEEVWPEPCVAVDLLPSERQILACALVGLLADIESSSRPYVIKVHARWCPVCMMTKGVWNRVQTTVDAFSALIKSGSTWVNLYLSHLVSERLNSSRVLSTFLAFQKHRFRRFMVAIEPPLLDALRDQPVYCVEAIGWETPVNDAALL
jgi:hypothetical protein